MSTQLTSGSRAEQQAVQLLIDAGAHIVVRNFRCRCGEIDIIALLNGYLVFVEVRLRTAGAYCSAAESVDIHKQKKIIRSARYFLASQPRWQNWPCRFDVIAFQPRQSGIGTEPHWIQAAFTL